MWEGIIGKHGIGKCNSNGLLLFMASKAYNLVITNTLFRLPTRQKTSWMHPRSKHWRLIDYVITRQRDRNNIRVTRAMCGAECWTDHHLIVSKVRLRIQPQRRPQGKKVVKRLNVCKLSCSTVSNMFEKELKSKLEDTTADKDTSIEDQWTTFRDMVYPIALEVIGPVKRKNQDWFDENEEAIQKLLGEKHLLFRAHMTRMIPNPSQRKMPTSKQKETCRGKLEKCKTVGVAKRLLRSRAMLASIAQSASMKQLRPYMDLSPQAHHLSSALMGPNCSPKETRS